MLWGWEGAWRVRRRSCGCAKIFKSTAGAGFNDQDDSTSLFGTDPLLSPLASNGAAPLVLRPN